MPEHVPSASAPVSPGLHVGQDGSGTFAVVAPRAQAVDLCIRRGRTETRHRLRRVDGPLHWDRVTGMTPGTEYGIRVYGRWDPEAGHFANPEMLLLDPYARGVSHASPLLTSMFPYEVDSMLEPVSAELAPSPFDSGPTAVWSVHLDGSFDWQEDRAPRTPWEDTVLYEAHVKGLTALHPRVPSAQRGTYAGLGHRAVTDHLRSLGVTAIELMPIHAAMDEPHLTRLGLTNYWGYSTLSFLAPNPALATAAAQRAGAQAVLDEVRTMVRSLHAAGIEVILDVVYNHTAEGGALGPSLSLRGLDAAEYYWLSEGSFLDVTGTGGTLDPRSVHVMDLILASLRYWAQEVHVDGFRFDLATALARDDGGFRADHPLLRAISTDPVLRGLKLIAEPWDVGSYGWRTGGFLPPFAEWNDAFRDGVRGYWLAQPRERERSGDPAIGGVRDLATRLAGSSDLFTRQDPSDLPAGRTLRSAWASVNYLTAHDGFTLADLTSYDDKHNEANGEDGRDGTEANRSWNHGHEGPVDPGTADGARIAAQRRRTRRSMLATLLLASGTPMITAGDELSRTQQGNNNAYCQDNEISWVDWSLAESEESCIATVRTLLALRREHPQLRTRAFPRPADPADLREDQVAWFGREGEELSHEDWFDPRRHVLQMLRPGPEHVLVVISGADRDLEVTLPAQPWPTGTPRIVLDTSREDGGTGSDPMSRPVRGKDGRQRLQVPARSVVVIVIGDTSGVEERLP
ncbi:glycogen debranching protein GlgX [Brachybacterium phenoliresistens]|uniref:Glycogen debranching protein n=1 Tax=Brachybacterium phenoliresistens TaxID=396014 RepID=Z9JZ37_9MICO|nr:glycogen debranching protein GlgX [Brachybacterium phenoliresistens]EWS83027.1 glycogen debranching protein [Brachybacterium phenoliresistens]